jgi:hypothetical protein
VERGGNHAVTENPALGTLAMLRRWVSISLGYLLLVALLGTFLRLTVVYPVEGVNYRNFLHAHSHVAFLGWVFNALLVGLLYAYLPGKAGSYRVLFAALQVSVLGMLFSFPVQGYAAVSIAFSTLHILLSWVFAYRFLGHVRERAGELAQHRVSLVFARWGLFFMVLSSVGPFALGAIMARGLGHTHWYQLAIYFYLHFQYDGWFTFAVLGLFCWVLERASLPLSSPALRRAAHLLAFSCLAGYALSTLWTHPPAPVYALAWVAVAVQLGAVLLLAKELGTHRKSIAGLLCGWPGKLMGVALAAFCLKVVMQSASALPAVADLAVGVRNFTIGYLHLVFLGCITPFLLAWLLHHRLLRLTRRHAGWCALLLLAGFAASEAYLFAQPLLLMAGFGLIPAYFTALCVFSALMAAGTALMLLPGRER